MRLLKDNWRNAKQVIIIDLIGDGRPDLAAVAEHDGYEFRSRRNQGRRRKQRVVKAARGESCGGTMT